MPSEHAASRPAVTGRPVGPVRAKLIEVLLHQGATGDYFTLAARAGIAEAWRVQQTVRDMAREGLVQRCAVAPSGARPRHVYCAADHESGHQFMARTLLQAWR